MGAQVTPSKRAKAERRRDAGSAGRTATKETREVLNALRHIVRSLRVSSRNAEQRVGLSGAQLFVLQCLSRQSPCSVNELAVATATDQSSVSVVVSRLVARGYVKRATSKLDRRSVELSLSAAGRTLLISAPEAAQDRLLAALSKLKKSELFVLSALLGKVVELAEVPRESPSLFFEDGPTLARSKGRGSDARG
jgi:DNA-binding MarR family transcriptional regulator